MGNVLTPAGEIIHQLRSSSRLADVQGIKHSLLRTPAGVVVYQVVYIFSSCDDS